MDKYHIAFFIKSEDGLGMGRVVMETKLNLCNSRDLVIAEDLLKVNNKAENLVILNFIKLED